MWQFMPATMCSLTLNNNVENIKASRVRGFCLRWQQGTESRTLLPAQVIKDVPGSDDSKFLEFFKSIFLHVFNSASYCVIIVSSLNNFIFLSY